MALAVITAITLLSTNVRNAISSVVNILPARSSSSSAGAAGSTRWATPTRTISSKRR